MNTIADRLGVGRSTLYRWIGSREQLLGWVVCASIGEIWEAARRSAEGAGLERMLSSCRIFIDAVGAHSPLVTWAQREPNLALRVLLDPDGDVTSALRQSMQRALQREMPNSEVSPEVFQMLALAATALVWGNVAGHRNPDADSAIGIMRTVLSAHLTT
ncbi:QsdR family transcriptional regulator [Gordonia malaquae]|uniref:QsdR family transcriptional regulator n=1 Tax=Gordonia malaquae TaxID=410332 RepID=UPI0030FE9CBD